MDKWLQAVKATPTRYFLETYTQQQVTIKTGHWYLGYITITFEKYQMKETNSRNSRLLLQT